MRKKNREISETEEILAVIQKCDVCRIALNHDGFPYIVPLNFGVDNQNGKITFYFHSADEGLKLDCIRKDNRAGFELDCGHQLQYFREKGYCTMAYESIIGRGTIHFVPDEKKREALECIMAHYHPEGERYFSPDAIPRTAVYCLKVDEITGKRKNPK